MAVHSAANRNVTLGVLILTSSTSVLATDLYAPSLPALPAFFDASAAMVKLTMSLNVLAHAFCQLISS
jgi:DHA1 family bicyclomycin/chloramphenicol resistance-like MFS transporter